MVSMDWLLRHRRMKVAETDRLIPNDGRSLSSTLRAAHRVACLTGASPVAGIICLPA